MSDQKGGQIGQSPIHLRHVCDVRTYVWLDLDGTSTLTSDCNRHAVSVDERRCKFRPALLQQDRRQAGVEHMEDDIKEVFFPGNHGDVGGGWLAPGDNGIVEEDDPLQLSDLALEWMISELDALPAKHQTDQIDWNAHKDIFMRNFHRKVSTAVQAPIHDILKYGSPGVSRVSTFMWHILGEVTLIYLVARQSLLII